MTTTPIIPETERSVPPPSVGRALIDTLWMSPLWAIPFALFFGTIFGPGLKAYWITYKMSLVFAFLIRLALVAVRWAIVPALRRRLRRSDPLPVAIEAPVYAVCCMIASYLAAGIIHRFVLPGFLGSPRAIVTSGAYTLLFTATFSGIAYAHKFYRESLARARAIESIRAELAEAELRALRAQVQPHFLFNTLNTIAALIRENPAEAEETVTRLADVFRYSLRASENPDVRLADELAFVRAYLDIERTRFGARLRVVEDLGPGLEGARVPSLLLQPLVENAVRYAVSPRSEGGAITLTARGANGLLIIDIADDGPGIDAEAAPAGLGFGLHSVRERLEGLGAPHTFVIDSSRTSGTRIRLTLPLRFDPSTDSRGERS